MGAQRIPLNRSEISGQFDAGESAQIMSIRFDPTFTSPNTPSSGSTTNLGAEDLFTNRPLVINEYKMEVVHDCSTQLFQYYCDDDEITNADNWSTTSSEFLQSLKNHKLGAGSITQSDATGAQPVKTTLYYKKKRAPKWLFMKTGRKWLRPPIVLSANKKNCFGLSVCNVSATDARSYYAFVTIKDWAYLD